MEPTKTWIDLAADEVEKQVAGRGAGAKVVCASGVSPSGTIHLGNLREVMTVHLVAEELKRRGYDAVHIHSWDDYDRLRKVPGNVPAEFAAHIGKPLADVPDPAGEYPSYAERFIADFTRAAAEIGVFPRYIRQSIAYRRGDYLAEIKVAMSRRLEIFDILAQYQTLEQERSAEERREEYYPFKVYCEACGRDTTTITRYQEQGAVIDYRCGACKHTGRFSLDEKVQGKLVWKVDWPMRWKFEGVDFEPGGEDHSAPGSSYTVGQQVVRAIYDRQAPYFIGYAFVGMSGRSKMSSSSGTAVSPRAALDILEPGILRWLYIRRKADQKFNIDFGQEVLRLYDEWDTFINKVQTGAASPEEVRLYERCLRTGSLDHAIPRPSRAVSFRLLSSAADITQGSRPQILRIVADHLAEATDPAVLERELEPRLTCAIHWATEYVPNDERTNISPVFNSTVYEALDERNREGIRLLTEKLADSWSLDGLTKLVYGIPKLLLGLAFDAAPTPEVKVAQRNFFAAVYQLICTSETGPRLPTLFLSLGLERVLSLLTPPQG